MILRRTCLMILVLGLACSTTGPRRGPPGGSEAELIALNALMYERMLLHHDAGPYLENALPDYLFIANIGIVENLEEVTTTLDNLSIQSVRLENEAALIRGTTGVLIGTMHIRGSVVGFPLPERMRYMSVFVWADDAWKLLSQSLTPIDDPRLRPPS